MFELLQRRGLVGEGAADMDEHLGGRAADHHVTSWSCDACAGQPGPEAVQDQAQVQERRARRDDLGQIVRGTLRGFGVRACVPLPGTLAGPRQS
jgi:hypothetical protein